MFDCGKKKGSDPPIRLCQQHLDGRTHMVGGQIDGHSRALVEGLLRQRPNSYSLVKKNKRGENGGWVVF